MSKSLTSLRAFEFDCLSGQSSTVVYLIITVHNFIYKVKDMYENEKMYGKDGGKARNVETNPSSQLPIPHGHLKKSHNNTILFSKRCNIKHLSSEGAAVVNVQIVAVHVAIISFQSRYIYIFIFIKKPSLLMGRGWHCRCVWWSR